MALRFEDPLVIARCTIIVLPSREELIYFLSMIMLCLVSYFSVIMLIVDLKEVNFESGKIPDVIYFYADDK